MIDQDRNRLSTQVRAGVAIGGNDRNRCATPAFNAGAVFEAPQAPIRSDDVAAVATCARGPAHGQQLYDTALPATA